MHQSVREIVTTFVDKLTGKQTIFQCMQLDEEVVKRGGKKADPGLYKAEYLRRLGVHIKARLTALELGKALWPRRPRRRQSAKAPEGRRLFPISRHGTDEADVLEEAKLLGVEGYFDGGIYGARDNMTTCSKEIVIKDIVAGKQSHRKRAGLLW